MIPVHVKLPDGKGDKGEIYPESTFEEIKKT